MAPTKGTKGFPRSVSLGLGYYSHSEWVSGPCSKQGPMGQDSSLQPGPAPYPSPAASCHEVIATFPSLHPHPCLCADISFGKEVGKALTLPDLEFIDWSGPIGHRLTMWAEGVCRVREHPPGFQPML